MSPPIIERKMNIPILPISYRIRNGQVQIVLLWFLVFYRIPLRDIILIEKISWLDIFRGYRTRRLTLRSFRMGNGIAWETIEIYKESGVIHAIGITPMSPTSFIVELATACPQLKQTGEWRWEASESQ